MSDTERLKFEGRAAEARQRMRQLRLRIDGLRNAVRDALDPFERPERLRADEAAENAVALAEACIQYKAMLSEIDAIEHALGRRW